jgi:hypothetical protein
MRSGTLEIRAGRPADFTRFIHMRSTGTEARTTSTLFLNNPGSLSGPRPADSDAPSREGQPPRPREWGLFALERGANGLLQRVGRSAVTLERGAHDASLIEHVLRRNAGHAEQPGAHPLARRAVDEGKG